MGLRCLRTGLRALPGLSLRRSPGRWRPSSETDSLRGAQLQGSLAESSWQGPCPGQPPGTAWSQAALCAVRKRFPASAGKEKEKVYIVFFLPKTTLVVKICLEARQLLVAIRLWEGGEKVPVFNFCSPPSRLRLSLLGKVSRIYTGGMGVLFEEGCRPKWKARWSNLLNEMS